MSELKSVHVTVLSVETRERAHVSGSGGGGYMERGYGKVQAISIHTHHERLLEVWAKNDAGREVNFTLPGDRFAARAGHMLRLLYFGEALWAVKNLTTETTKWFADPGSLAGVAKPIRFINALAACLIIATPVLVWGAMAAHPPAKMNATALKLAFIYLPIVTCAWAMWRNNIIRRKHREMVSQWSEIFARGGSLLEAKDVPAAARR